MSTKRIEGRGIILNATKIGAGFLLLLYSGLAHGETFIVNSSLQGEEAQDVNPGDGVAENADGLTTWAAAHMEANALAGSDTIAFSQELAYPLHLDGVRISDSLTIMGPEDGKVVIMNRLEILHSAMYVHIENLSFEDTSGYVFMHPPDYGAGAIDVLGDSVVTVRRCDFKRNHSGNWAITYGVSSFIDCHFINNTGTIVRTPYQAEMRDCTFWSNSSYEDADTAGAHPLFNGGVLEFSGCLFYGNVAEVALLLFTDTSIMTHCTFRENIGRLASDINEIHHCYFFDNADLAVPIIGKMSNVTFWKNTVASGGIQLWDDTEVVNVNFVENTGGGLVLAQGARLLNSLIANNEITSEEVPAAIYGVSAEDVVTLGNTIVAGNRTSSGLASDVSGPYTSLGGNLIGVGNNATGFDGPGDMVGTAENPIDPRLGPVWEYGGGLPSVRLLPGSPAIDAGLNSLIMNPPFDGPPFYDIRGEGFPRIVNGTVDIGAYEVQADDAQWDHSADYEPDAQLSLSELPRVVQYYNLDAYHCDATTEDGYAPGEGTQDCAPHDTDYNPQNWYISLRELLRSIQLFNATAYVKCQDMDTEDGFCPVFGD